MEPGHDPQPSAELDSFVAVLIQVGAQLSLIIDHMARSAPRSAPDAPPVSEVMHRVLASALASLATEPGALAAAGTLLRDAGERIGEEIFLVPVEGTNPSLRRRRRRRGR